MPAERDHPPGSPAAADYQAGSAEAADFLTAQREKQVIRDWPKGHPAAADNPNRVEPTRPLDTARDASRGADQPAKPAE